MITNYLGAAERAGVQVRPDRAGASGPPLDARDGYRYVVTASVLDNEGDDPTPPADRRARRRSSARC